jgi:multiple sugar transport system permease protein
MQLKYLELEVVNSMKITMKKKEALSAWVFLMPSLVGFVIFVFGATIVSLLISFFDWDMLTPAKFVGLGNYLKLLKSDSFFLVLRNTVIFVIGTVPTRVIFSLLLALILVKKIPGRVFFRSAIFLPVAASTVAVAMIWRWIFNADFGLLNDFLYRIGISQLPQWLINPNWALMALIIFSVWKDVGFSTVLFMAGLEGIPDTLYEAGEIDGASSWIKFWKITLPLLSPTTFFVVVLNLISSFQVFDQAYVLTGGGPAYATTTIVYYIYNYAFQRFKMGYACATAWILFAIIFVITIIQFKNQKKWVYYI